MNARRIALFSGPLFFLFACFMPPIWGMPHAAQLTAGVTLWMAIWWITEPVDTAVTALLPLVLFPVTGVLPLKPTAAEYSNEIVYLFMAGFLFGKAIERWNLHRRIALMMVLWLGSNPKQMLLGFMLSTAFISTWISNTATAVMMTPVAIAVAGVGLTKTLKNKEKNADIAVPTEAAVGLKPENANFAKALMLGIGYACSIGGMATLVGTPTNAIFVSFVDQKMHESVSFWKWFQFGFPFSLVVLLLCWRLLCWLFPLEKTAGTDASRERVRVELTTLGHTTAAEKRLMALFALVIAGWVSGSLLWYDWLHWTSATGDTVVVMTGAIVLFLMPSTGTTGISLMDWKHAERIPWGVIVFFGGGLAMAKGFDVSGLAQWLGSLMEGLRALPIWLILLVVLTVVVLLSEVASNIATASMMMPVLASLAVSLGIHPFGLLMSATLAASVGFGLPIATAPNTIVFGAGYLNARDMAKAGFLLDIICIVVLMMFVYWVMPIVWGISLIN